MVSTTAAEEIRAPAGYARRFTEVTVFVAVWMALGFALGDLYLYLLVGVPLTVVFQLVVRRRLLRELWVRDGQAFHLDRKGKVIAGALMILPVITLVLTAGQWLLSVWLMACVVGAVPAAYAICHLRSDSVRITVRWTAIATVAGVAAMVASLVPLLIASPEPLRSSSMLVTGLHTAILLIPALFVLEEVTFRGALDSHVHGPGDGRVWLSALFVSTLFGLWHLPIVVGTSQGVLATVAQLLVVHWVIGVPLSFAWRRTGSLVAPGLAHALINGVRDALYAGLS
ncbi:MAG: CPBP family glutamic-type intramembrane protease [Egibacteraceae bacterium]